MRTIEQSWRVIEEWLAANAPSLLAGLVAGAHSMELQTIEGRIGPLNGSLLPEDLRASLSIHNGQADADSPLIGGWRLLGTSQVLESWQMHAEFRRDGTFSTDLDDDVINDRGVRRAWSHEGWIPVAEDGAGNYVCIDVAPADGGAVGQLVGWYHDDDPRPLVASSFAAWLDRAATWMIAGKVQVEAHGYGLIQLRYAADFERSDAPS
jgi:cell wall assembly regulator SMI1